MRSLDTGIGSDWYLQLVYLDAFMLYVNSFLANGCAFECTITYGLTIELFPFVLQNDGQLHAGDDVQRLVGNDCHVSYHL